ncbi:uncharacterized protein BX663DRAFT_506663 [Cokeromyces recurvatus]|uniref:uncharacterized protein n=1 Tax=Cokeromyces recurvatus TaxID=90255 RepID=UPI00221EDC47|nr:uncharacterized protein BX663DRAFT_506663 [Cokeromyces recurvatus]KAI7903494.1 hypothetical protein BX663DRAFT_506663 [Cokeromyces recurvatus]
MFDMNYNAPIIADSIKSETSSIGTNNEPMHRTGGDAVHMLLAKLDEGTQTIANLRSILTMKTAELNELLAQLELTNQAITTVESTTTQIENMLKDLGFSENSRESLLMSAEQSLDSAIKSATSIYPQQFKHVNRRRPSTTSTNSGSAAMTEGSDHKRYSNARLFTTRIRYKPDTKNILRKLNDLLRDLNLESGNFFSSIGTTDDYEVLQKAYVDLDIAKTISLSAKSNMKRRNILMRSARRRENMEEIQNLGDKIREGVSHWKIYTRNTPLLINGEDIITILDREDNLLARNLPIPSTRTIYEKPTTITPSNSVKRSSIPSVNTKQVSIPQHQMSSSIINNDIPPSSPTKSTLVTKKLQRQSVGGPRLTQVKASVGLPRVRTSSITQQKEHQQQKSLSGASTPPHSAIITKPIINTIKPTITTTAKSTIITTTTTTTTAKATINIQRQTHIPLPTSVTQQSTSEKKSILKPPSQRGPGSTYALKEYNNTRIRTCKTFLFHCL